MLIDRHYDRIYQTAWRFAGTTAMAEDVAQDVVVKLARAIRGFRGDAAFTTWVYRIIYTTAIDHLRVAQRTDTRSPSNIVTLMDARPDLGGEQKTPEDVLQNEDLWCCVRNLSPKQRDAVLLVYAEELSHAQAAEIMGCSEKTVSWHLFEAKKRLKVELEAEE
ncbi:MAG: RNA polymerase sigma factor [Hyphomicrobiaceae bacterium]